MAAAEARAAWQRTANRCFVQEDARRAPKLPSCSSSSSSSKSESDGRPGDAENGSDHPTPGCMPHHLNPNQLLDTKWWLHLQPKIGHQKDFMYEHLNALEAEIEVMSADFVNQTDKLRENQHPIEAYDTQPDTKNNTGSFLDQPLNVSATCMKSDEDARMTGLKAALGNNPQKTPKIKDMGEFWYPDDHLMDLDPFGLVSKQPQKLSSDLDSHWLGSEKTGPWWRTADKDELASLVAQKSLEHIENCDLPRPQSKRFSGAPSNGILNLSLDQKAEMGFLSLANYIHGSPTSVGMDEKQCSWGDVGSSPLGSDRLFSVNNSNSITDKDQSETRYIPDNGPSKAQLLEALCHSQTRAREAEKAAQQAYTEKEHIIKLFFKQASQLFAYKQWLQLLQLENLCLQLKNKNQPISTLFPVVLPWLPHKSGQPKKGKHKAAKKKHSPPRYEISKSAVAFAVGLGLAGAGLLLGWTMGWLSPAF
ncbi:hypothetical protein L1049_020007 [Liquidambar formosana]|uniref:Uncharacterized protein n=1 Tax=Liquidambar formosana TaxID=63359 RepID=A0AAP0S6I8_LIQFO